ncbi:homoserine kinase [Paenibacillus montanisoli]|uniref:Homoserine kinase n=1 Tax=Paenibacillus montanisoli TaxID=2081970 RepID=A0A328UDP1_9BACL|nr:homoserine kinase [Paenibacillus montanisoli]RAP78454.1 homoserine kinase [Paenibacillus montanisoli]
MAIKTEFSEGELSEIVEEYDLGKFVSSFSLSGGTVQTNIGIITTKGKFVFRYYEHRPPEAVLFEMDLLLYLKEHNYPCPAPYKNNQGSYVGNCKHKPYAIFECMEGAHIGQPTAEQQQKLIQKVAELHKLTENYLPVHKDMRLNYNAERCRQLGGEVAERINNYNAYQKLAWLENELGKLELPAALPMGVCHADFHFSNVLFIDDEVSALLDFDDANYTYLLFDLIGLIEYSAWRRDKDHGLNFDQAKKVVFTYNSFRPLTTNEAEHLFDVYKLSILIDCIWYFERGDASDFYERRKIDFLNQLGRKGFSRKIFG